MKLKSSRAFTLIEMLVTTIVIAMTGAFMVTSISVLSRSHETAQNKSLALNLLQKSQEEVRRAVYEGQVDFDQLGTCQFPQPNNPIGTCGFDQITQTFPGFTRTLTVQSGFGSTEVKRIIVDVAFQQLGQPQTLSSVVLLSRPPAPLPGNIIGFVHPSNASTPISAADITASRVNSTQVRTTISSTAIGVKGENFNFADPLTGAFVLSTGQWNITARHNSHEDYIHAGNPVTIGSGQEIFLDIAMIPKPTNAIIRGDVVDQLTNQRLANFNRAFVELYDNGTRIGQIGNQSTFSFTIPFQNTTQQCFTLRTNDAFKAGYAYATPPGGINPSCPFAWNREGYSTAAVGAAGQLLCSNAFNGTTTTDRVCVNPGDNLPINLPVRAVPEVLITGVVKDDQGNVLANATVFARWPQSDDAEWRKLGNLQSTRTNSNGVYTFSVPAAQGMFANTNPAQNYLRVWAQASVSVLDCCNVARNQTRTSPLALVGPLFPNDPTRTVADLIIPTTQQCGNVQGAIRDDFGSFGIAAANVVISSTTQATNSAGNYIFDCPAAGFRLPQGSSSVTVTNPNYYTYNSGGNSQYAPGPSAIITANQVTTYNAKLWPRGVGTIQGTVRDKGTQSPISGATVTFRPYTGSALTATTTASGAYSFPNVIETWPPPTLPANDPYYRRNTLLHNLDVTHSSGIYQPVSQATPALIRGATLTVDVDLVSQGGL